MNMLLEWKQRRAAIKDELSGLNDTSVTEERAFTEDETTQWDGLTAEAELLEEQITRTEMLDGYEVNRPELPTDLRQTPEAPAYHPRKTPDTPEGIYCRVIRTGDEGAMAELRASNDTTGNITTSADGGYAVPTGHYQGIIKKARPRALPFLLDVQDIPGKGTTVNVPVDAEADTGVFIETAESSGFDRDLPAIGQVAMTLVMYTKKVDLTYQLLQDEDSRLLAFLENYVGAGYAATLNSLMVTEALADGTAALTLDSATVIGVGEIPELYYKLSAEYARGEIAWLVARATEGEIYSLSDTSTYRFASNPGGNALGAAILWGAPLYSDAGMGATAASAKSMLIADWGYMGMRLDPQMTFLRDPYTRSSSGEVILNYYFRADFEVMQAAAFQYATHPSA